MPDVLITSGQTVNTRQTLSGTDDLTVQSGGTLSVTANNQAARWINSANGVVVTNSGLIEAPNAGARALRFEDSITGAIDIVITNNASGVIRAGGDAIQVDGAVASGTFNLTNAGVIRSTVDGQAIDLTGLTSPEPHFLANTGTIQGDFNDAIRIGKRLTITNDGVINGGAGAAYSVNVDGVNYLDGSNGFVNNRATGQISGDRHGVNAGLATSLQVQNAAGGTITGRNGSGVGSDATLVVVNSGTITGSFSNSAGSDINGVTPGQPNGGGPDGQNDGDGDGIDADGRLTLNNSGLIQGTGSGGSGSDGFANTSEGVAAGGGFLLNLAGGTIIGVGLGILIDDSSRGNAPFVTEIVNSGTITGTNSFGIRIVSAFADRIDNAGVISGGGGVAIQFGVGDNTLKLRTGSSITGLSDGGVGVDLIDYTSFGSAVSVNLATGAATGTAGVVNFESVTGSAFADTIVGGAGANTLLGADGADQLNGGLGDDVVRGGLGDDLVQGGQNNDQLFGDEGNDTVSGGLGNDALNGGIGSDVVSGGDGDDFAVGGQGDDQVFGDAGNDTIAGGLGNDTLNGGVGDDTVNGNDGDDFAVGGQGDDLVSGDAGNDILAGGLGNDVINGNTENDTINGNDGNDELIGGQGDDSIFGDAGSDVLAGGLGADTLDGGTGLDFFLYTAAAQSTAASRDTINGFVSGEDKIDLRPVATPGSTFTITSAGGLTLLTVDIGGDGTTDMQIALSSAATLLATDIFI